MSDQLNGDLFPRSPKSQPRDRSTFSPALIVSIVSTSVAVLLAVYVVTLKAEVAKITGSAAAPIQTNKEVAPAPQATASAAAGDLKAQTELAHSQLNLSADGGASTYAWNVTLPQLTAKLPAANCNEDQNGGHTCILDTADQLLEACGFGECREEMITFDKADRMTAVLAAVEKGTWDRWITPIQRLGILEPHVSRINSLGISTKLTCYQLSEGHLTFSEVSGADFRGDPVRNPYNIAFSAIDGCPGS